MKSGGNEKFLILLSGYEAKQQMIAVVRQDLSSVRVLLLLDETTTATKSIQFARCFLIRVTD